MSEGSHPRERAAFWGRLYWISGGMLVAAVAIFIVYTSLYPNTYDSIRPVQYACFGMMALAMGLMWLSYLREDYWRKRR